MLRILTASSLIALAAIPAIAQQADPMAPPTPMDAPETVEAQPMAEPAPAPALLRPCRSAAIARTTGHAVGGS